MSNENILSFNDIVDSIKTAQDFLNPKWVKRKANQELKEQDDDIKKSKLGKYGYLTRKPKHPLSLWEIEFIKWEKEYYKNGFLGDTSKITRYIALGVAIKSIKNIKGANKLKLRLKSADTFYSTFFEIECAASYVDIDYKVEFIEECNNKTPDLKVTTKNGDVFYVECKYKNAKVDRQKKYDFTAEKIITNLLEIMNKKGINGVIIINLFDHLSDKEIIKLNQQILEKLDKSKTPQFQSQFQSQSQSQEFLSGKCQVAVQSLAENIKAVNFREMPFDLDYETITFDQKDNNDISNLKFIGIHINEEIDVVSGVLNSFKSAAKQLPEGEIGIVRIRIDDKGWPKDTELKFNEAKGLIEKELIKNQHTRINLVSIQTRRTIKSEGSIEYKYFDINIEHPYPKNII